MLSRTDYLASLPRRRLAAGALIRDEVGRVCLVEPTYKTRWHLPGGTVDADESPADACARELTEELGLAITVGRLLCLEWVAPEPPVDPHGALMLVYDGGVLDHETIERIVVPPDELRSTRFVDVTELDRFVTSANQRRIAASLAALADGAVVEADRSR